MVRLVIHDFFSLPGSKCHLEGGAWCGYVIDKLLVIANPAFANRTFADRAFADRVLADQASITELARKWL